MSNELTITIKFRDIEKTMTTQVPEYTEILADKNAAFEIFDLL